MWVALALAAAVPVVAGLCFLAHLLFLGFVITKTGGTDGLKDVAVAMRAYKVPLLNRNIAARSRSSSMCHTSRTRSSAPATGGLT